jgi:L-amino acid N-acyltransferase
MKRISCDRSYAGQILAILNDAIVNSTALWDYRPRTLDMMATWFDDKDAGDFPVIGFVDERDQLLAFGSYGTFRAWPAYKYTVEHSLYVKRSSRRRGLGTSMLLELVEHAEKQGYHNLIGGIATDNEISIKTHLKCGFEHCGTIRQCGYKFEKWIDLGFYQRILSAPSQPVDG